MWHNCPKLHTYAGSHTQCTVLLLPQGYTFICFELGIGVQGCIPSPKPKSDICCLARTNMKRAIASSMSQLGPSAFLRLRSLIPGQGVSQGAGLPQWNGVAENIPHESTQHS